MIKKLILLLSLSISGLVFTGCDGGSAQMGHKEANVLGIAKIEKHDYEPTGPNTFAVSTDELYSRKNFQGHKASFFWGLVTLKDY